jgi:cytoskeletal protein CcmA (bactofilin family)
MLFNPKKSPAKKDGPTASSASTTGTPTTTSKASDETRPSQGQTETRNFKDEMRSPTGRPGLRVARRTGSPPTSSALNPHLSFEGTLKFTGTVVVDCEFRGSVLTDDTLVVGPSGRLDADVTVGSVEISGKVHGDIKAKTTVKIFSGGEVKGNIETPTISMEEGVVFEGNCTRPEGAQQPRKVELADLDNDEDKDESDSDKTAPKLVSTLSSTTT